MRNEIDIQAYVNGFIQSVLAGHDSLGAISFISKAELIKTKSWGAVLPTSPASEVNWLNMARAIGMANEDSGVIYDHESVNLVFSKSHFAILPFIYPINRRSESITYVNGLHAFSINGICSLFFEHARKASSSSPMPIDSIILPFGDSVLNGLPGKIAWGLGANAHFRSSSQYGDRAFDKMPEPKQASPIKLYK